MGQIDLGSQLLNYIIRRGFQPGDRLPSISELAADEHLGMSTSKIREQLEVARALGLVTVRSKTGTHLQEYSFTPAVRLSLLFALGTEFSHFDLFGNLRIHIEAAYWHEACDCLQDEDVQQMQQCIDEAKHKLNSNPIRIPNQEHRQFHLTLYNHLENPFVLGLLEAYWDAYEAVGTSQYVAYDYLKSVWDYHQRILDLLYQRQYAAAKSAFIEHTCLLRYPISHHTNGKEEK